jgi:hypothetical protein
MEQNNHPAKYQTDQEWQEALRDRFGQLHTKISDLSNEATSYKSLSDAWQRKYNEMKQENAALYTKSKNFNELLDELQARCDRYEKALNAIIGRNMPVPNKADMIKIVRKALGLDEGVKIANEAISGEGKEEDARDKIALICHALAEEVAKDAGTAEEYLKKEGVDVDKIKEDAKFIAWLAELAALLHGAAQGQPIKINQEEARKWYDDGATPYQCFRETWNME